MAIARRINQSILDLTRLINDMKESIRDLHEANNDLQTSWLDWLVFLAWISLIITFYVVTLRRDKKISPVHNRNVAFTTHVLQPSCLVIKTVRDENRNEIRRYQGAPTFFRYYQYRRRYFHRFKKSNSTKNPLSGGDGRRLRSGIKIKRRLRRNLKSPRVSVAAETKSTQVPVINPDVTDFNSQTTEEMLGDGDCNQLQLDEKNQFNEKNCAISHDDDEKCDV